MSTKQKILIALAIMVLFNFILIIIFGDNGLVDLYLLKREKEHIISKNEAITQKNMSMYREIDRLRHDPQFIENAARRQLGMIAEDELIFKLEEEETPRNE